MSQAHINFTPKKYAGAVGLDRSHSPSSQARTGWLNKSFYRNNLLCCKHQSYDNEFNLAQFQSCVQHYFYLQVKYEKYGTHSIFLHIISLYTSQIIRSSVSFGLMVLKIWSCGFYLFSRLVSVKCTRLLFFILILILWSRKRLDDSPIIQ